MSQYAPERAPTVELIITAFKNVRTANKTPRQYCLWKTHRCLDVRPEVISARESVLARVRPRFRPHGPVLLHEVDRSQGVALSDLVVVRIVACMKKMKIIL